MAALHEIDTTYAKIDRVLARAETDPVFLADFGRRPFATLVEAGIGESTFLKELLGLPAATDRELVDVVRARLRAAAHRVGCGIAAQGCGIAADGSAIEAQGCGIAK